MKFPLNSGKSLLVLGTAVSMLAGLIVSKVIAVRLGPDGIGLAGSFMGLSALAASVALAGQTNALPRWIAEQPDSSKRDLLRASSVAALLLLAPIGLITSLVGAWLLRSQVSPALTVCALLVMSYANCVILQRPVFISAVASTAEVVRYGVVAAVVSTSVTVVMVWALPPRWLPAALALGTLAGAGAGFFQIRRLCGAPRRSGWGIGQAKHLLTFTRAAFVGTASNAIVMGLIPTITVVTLGAYDAGLFRASWSLAAVVFSFAASVIRFTYLPQLTQASIAGDSAIVVGRASIPQVMSVSALAAAVIAWMAPLILTLLYSREFRPAAATLGLLAAGTVARVWISVTGLAFIAHNRQRQYSTIHLVFVTMLLGVTVVGGLVGNLLLLGGLVAAVMFTGAVIAEITARRFLSPEHWPARSLNSKETLLIIFLLALSLTPPVIWST